MLAAAHQIAQGLAERVDVLRCELQFDRRKLTSHHGGNPSSAALQALTSACASLMPCKMMTNNCLPACPGDPIDLSSPAIPVL
ncbi:hypothetical protein DIPPA_24943 [Diplonema papillatum]|nr:hypothetical protein DIPPA_24943 [Diplonema papillatum]